MDHVQGNLSRFTMGPLYLLHTFSYIVHNTVGYIVHIVIIYGVQLLIFLHSIVGYILQCKDHFNLHFT